MCIEGIEVYNQATQTIAMAHTLSRIAYMAIHPEDPIVGFVAKNPKVKARFCHVFQLRKRKRALQVHKRVRKALEISEMEYELGKSSKSKDKKVRRKQSRVQHVLDDGEGDTTRRRRGEEDRRTDKTVSVVVEAIQEDPASKTSKKKKKGARSKDTAKGRRTSAAKPKRLSMGMAWLSVPKDRKKAPKRSRKSQANMSDEERQARRDRRAKRKKEEKEQIERAERRAKRRSEQARAKAGMGNVALG